MSQLRRDPHLIAVRRSLTAASLLVVLTLPFASAQADLASRPDIRARLHFAVAGGVYDPALWRYTSDQFVLPNLYSWLVRWVPGSGGYELEPDLAERWVISEDGLTYTFHLREGVQFHHGYGELTAEDVVFTFTRQMEDESMSYYSALEEISGIRAIDDQTVEITLDVPNMAFLSTIIGHIPGYIVSKRAVEELGEAFAMRPVGTGPFQFIELTSGGEVVLESFDDYWRGPRPIRRLTFAHVGEEQIAVAALRSNELQIIWTRGNPEAVAALEADPDIQTETISRPTSVRHVAFNPNFEPAQNVLVRRALSHAIDRDLIRLALPGLEVPADVFFALDTQEVTSHAFDPDLARALLAEAGYPNGFSVTIMFQSRSPEDILAEIVRSAWEDIGLDAQLEAMEATAAHDRRNSFDFDVTILSVGRPADPDLLFRDFFLSTSRPPGASNYFGYDAIDDLILEGRRISDPVRRSQIYHEAHEQVMRDLPIIPLSFQAFTVAWRAPVTGMAHGQNNNFWGETIEISR